MPPSLALILIFGGALSIAAVLIIQRHGWPPTGDRLIDLREADALTPPQVSKIGAQPVVYAPPIERRPARLSKGRERGNLFLWFVGGCIALLIPVAGPVLTTMLWIGGLWSALVGSPTWTVSGQCPCCGAYPEFFLGIGRDQKPPRNSVYGLDCGVCGNRIVYSVHQKTFRLAPSA